VPMNHFRAAGVVGDLDGDGLVFFETQHRARHLAIVGDGLEPAARREIESDRRDVELVVGHREILRQGGKRTGQGREAGQLQQISARYHIAMLAIARAREHVNRLICGHRDM
jgi:cytolysin (calcineurin-like family phosphatase)